METVDRALAARSRGERSHAIELFRSALADERDAAFLVAEGQSSEPTRSVLLRSAAALALDAEQPREAERLIGLALSGNPPEEVADELRDLFERVNFQRHLDVKGVTLTPDEFQMSLAGDAVGYGMAEQDELVTRVNWVRTLLYRTAERKQGRSFRERGRVPSALRREFDVFLSAPRAASMAVSFRFGSLRQPELAGDGLRRGRYR